MVTQPGENRDGTQTQAGPLIPCSFPCFPRPIWEPVLRLQSFCSLPSLLASAYQSLPCRSKEADGKEEELEAGPGSFSLDSIQWGLNLALSSDPDKLGGGQCHRFHPSIPAPC